MGTSHSKYFVQEEVLPQGSLLSVTLFAIAINEITKQLGSEVHCTLYVEDFTIFVSAATITHSTRIIQIAINSLEQWTKTKGMRFSLEKTAAIKFEKRKKGEEPQLTLRGSRIQVRESTCYLGLITLSRPLDVPLCPRARSRLGTFINISYPLVPYPHTYIALYSRTPKLPVTHTHPQKHEIVVHPS